MLACACEAWRGRGGKLPARPPRSTAGLRRKRHGEMLVLVTGEVGSGLSLTTANIKANPDGSPEDSRGWGGVWAATAAQNQLNSG